MVKVFAEARFALCESVPPPGTIEDLWTGMRREATQIGERDGLMLSLVTRLVLNRAGFAEALAHLLAGKLQDADLPAPALTRLMLEIYDRHPAVLEAAVMDLLAVRERDPASPDLILVFLNLKGFHAVQASRVAHVLWRDDRQPLALVIQARAAEVFGVDIHPAARLGCGIMIDHGTGVGPASENQARRPDRGRGQRAGQYRGGPWRQGWGGQHRAGQCGAVHHRGGRAGAAGGAKADQRAGLHHGPDLADAGLFDLI
jgi:hypothetical protein